KGGIPRTDGTDVTPAERAKPNAESGLPGLPVRELLFSNRPVAGSPRQARAATKPSPDPPPLLNCFRKYRSPRETALQHRASLSAEFAVRPAVEEMQRASADSPRPRAAFQQSRVVFSPPPACCVRANKLPPESRARRIEHAHSASPADSELR